MKAKRRQELKTNDLAQAIEDLGRSFREWGVYIVGAVALVIVVVLVVSYRNSAKADAVGQAYAELRTVSEIAPSGVRKSEVEIEQALAKIERLASNTDDEGFRLDALLRHGTMALQYAESGEYGIVAKYLTDARKAFDLIGERYPDRTLHYGRALYGLFQIEADLFAVDGDSNHRDRAVSYLETLRDDTRFNGTPFQVMAVDMLNTIDEVFTVVTFPEAPAPAVSPAPIPAATPAPIPAELPTPENAGEMTAPVEPSVEAPGVGTGGLEPELESDDPQ